jgi:uncharacterized protein YdeI (YjbR/CyaY-like superfamily)
MAPAVFFPSQARFRAWLRKNGAKAAELLVAPHKAGSGKGGLTYPQALDEALCAGWIDGVRKNLDATSYTVRFTPRKAKSYWSAVNVRHFERLSKEGRIQPKGLAAFRARDAAETARYSFERAASKLDAAQERAFRANRKAWDYFQSQAPWYRRTATFWVTSARQEETRARRLATLIADSGRGKRIGLLKYSGKKGK